MEWMVELSLKPVNLLWAPSSNLERSGSIQSLPHASDCFACSPIIQALFLKPEDVLGLFLVKSLKSPGMVAHVTDPSI